MGEVLPQTKSQPAGKSTISALRYRGVRIDGLEGWKVRKFDIFRRGHIDEARVGFAGSINRTPTTEQTHGVGPVTRTQRFAAIEPIRRCFIGRLPYSGWLLEDAKNTLILLLDEGMLKRTRKVMYPCADGDLPEGDGVRACK